MKRYTIDVEWAGARIDRFIRALHPGTPFAAIQTMLRKGAVTLNGQKAPGGRRLAAGDRVEVRGTRGGETTAGKRRPGAGPARGDVPARYGSIGAEITVLYEDDDILVIDKPRGLVVQPGNNNRLGSLLDLLEIYRAGRSDKPERTLPDNGRAREFERSPETGRLNRSTQPLENEPPPFPYTPVHRLDRETTGALVIAKTRRAARAMSDAFRTGLVEKTYLVLVEGAPAPPRGTIDTPLRIRKGRRSRARPDPGGKRSETRYATIRTIAGRSLLEVRIATGRTHQIRAHLAGKGCPVAGDRRYGATGRSREILHLHAWKISFAHPVSGAAVEAAAPPPAWAET
jgi:23S rRNA-/tRNA-specific pseudouridylate synthase